MMDLKIDYSLSFKEMCLFPVVSAYGVRHLNKKDWLNKTIGLIEVCPLIGALVSVIERLVVAIFDYMFNTSVQKKALGLNDPHQNWVDPYLAVCPDPVLKQWKADFKAEALAHFEKAQQKDFKVQSSTADLSLTTAEEATLCQVVEELNQYKGKDYYPKNVTVYSRNLCWVFSIDEIPNKVFKAEMMGQTSKNFEESQNAAAQAETVIQDQNLYLLHIPQQKEFKSLFLIMESPKR